MFKMYLITGQWKYYCSVCNKGCPNSGWLKSHMQSHTGVIRKYVCDQCARRFSRKQELVSCWGIEGE